MIVGTNAQLIAVVASPVKQKLVVVLESLRLHFQLQIFDGFRVVAPFTHLRFGFGPERLELLLNHTQRLFLISWHVGLLVVVKAVVTCVQEVVLDARRVIGQALDMVRAYEPLIFGKLVRHSSLDRFQVVVGWQVQVVRCRDVVIDKCFRILDRAEFFLRVEWFLVFGHEELLTLSLLFEPLFLGFFSSIKFFFLVHCNCVACLKSSAIVEVIQCRESVDSFSLTPVDSIEHTVKLVAASYLLGRLFVNFEPHLGLLWVKPSQPTEPMLLFGLLFGHSGFIGVSASRLHPCDASRSRHRACRLPILRVSSQFPIENSDFFVQLLAPLLKKAVRLLVHTHALLKRIKEFLS